MKTRYDYYAAITLDVIIITTGYNAENILMHFVNIDNQTS